MKSSPLWYAGSILALLLCAEATLAQGNPQIPAGRRVYTNCEEGVNYIVHVYTLAGAGFTDDEYVAKYKNTIPSVDLDYLRKNSGLLSFLRQDSGQFAGAFYFAPARVNLKSRDEFARYFSAWKKALAAKSFAPLAALADAGLENYKALFALDENDWQTRIVPLIPVFTRIGEIFTNSFQSYHKNVWPEVKLQLETTVLDLNTNLAPLNLLPAWERVTGYDFGNHSYCVSLFYAGKKGPSFNDTGLYKNTAYYGMERARFLDMISHEVGIHVLMPHLSALLDKSGKEIPKIDDPYIYGNVSYMAFESMAAYYNRKVLGRDALDLYCSNDPLAFLEIYGQLDGSGSTPEDVFRNGVEAYVARWTNTRGISDRFQKCESVTKR